FTGRAGGGKRERQRRLPGRPEATASQHTTEPTEAEPQGNHHARHVARLPEGEAIRAEQEPGGKRRSQETTVVGEPARPKARPGPAIRLERTTHARRRIPAPPRSRRLTQQRAQPTGLVVNEAFAARDVPFDPCRVGAQVHVVPKVTVRQHVQQPRSGHTGNQHRQPEVDDDVGIVPDAARPKRAHGRGEHEAREQKDEVTGKSRVEEREELALHDTKVRRARWLRPDYAGRDSAAAPSESEDEESASSASAKDLCCWTTV